MKNIIVFGALFVLVGGCVSFDAEIPVKSAANINEENLSSDQKIAEARRAFQEWHASSLSQAIKMREAPTLYTFTSRYNEFRPQKNSIYSHNDGDIRVIQVITEKSEDKNLPKEIDYVLAFGDDLAIGVFNDREYVTGELLVKGEYRYLGTYTYPTTQIIDGVKKEGTNTVRMFAEVGCEFDKYHMKDEPKGIEPPKKATEKKKVRLSSDEEARNLALIRKAFYNKWKEPKKGSYARVVDLGVLLCEDGRVLGYDIQRTSLSPMVDKSVLEAASKVDCVKGLSPAFLEENKVVTIRFEVTSLYD